MVTWMSFAFGERELRGGVLSMLETHMVMSSLIFCLILILMFYLAFTLVLHVALFHVLFLSLLMDLTITHMVLAHEITALSLDALVTTHVLIVVILSYVGLVLPLEGPSLTFSRDSCPGPLWLPSPVLHASCHHDKMIAASHSLVNTVMTEQPGQLLHMDTVGPSQVLSMGGKWYVLVIIDNYSRYSWVFLLERKGKVFEHFRSLALRLNNEHPNYLKAIRSDNGTKFRNGSFDQFCLEHGVDQQFSTPRLPQQNGVMERKNCTLVEMARTMLDEHRTPRHFWANAISTACYISN
jgi:hypothetical protein